MAWPRFRRSAAATAPIVRIGQGDYRRDIHPHHLTKSTEGPDVTIPSKIALGFLIREPADVYHAKATNHLSSHWLAEFRKCPLLYHRKRVGLIPERDSAAFLVGRAAHTLILEGRARYESEYAVGGPINPKTGKPYGSATKAFAEWAERSAKPVLSDDQAALIEQMAAAVAGHPLTQELLAEGIAEGVVRCRLHEHDCQARIDWLSPYPRRGIVDLKGAGIDWSLLGFNEDDLAKLLAGEAGVSQGLTDPDSVPEPPDDPVTHPGDLWILGDHRLLCGDSSCAADLDRLLDGAPIHLANTDPPYNVRLMYRTAA